MNTKEQIIEVINGTIEGYDKSPSLDKSYINGLLMGIELMTGTFLLGEKITYKEMKELEKYIDEKKKRIIGE